MPDNKGMKYFFLLTFLLSYSIHAVDSSTPGDGIGNTEPEAPKAYGQAVETEDDGGILEKLREHNLIKPKYDTCLQEKERNSFPNGDTFATRYPGGLGDCVWTQLPESEREQVQELVAQVQEAENGRAPAGQNEEKKEFDGVNLVNTKRTTLDPVDEKVKEFFAKKIIDGMYGTEAGKKVVVDHENFYSLYKSRISKNILEAISSFCVEAMPVSGSATTPDGSKSVPVSGFIIPQSTDPVKSVELRKLARKFNIENMKESTQDSDGNPMNLAQSIWTSCMTNIDKVCTEKVMACKTKPAKKGDPCTDKFPVKLDESFYNGAVTEVEGSKRFDKANSDPSAKKNVGVQTVLDEIHKANGGQNSAPQYDVSASFTETTGKACQVSQYLKGARQSLKALEKVDEKLAVNRGKKSDRIQMTVCKSVEKGKCKEQGELKDYDSGDKEKGIDALTTLTSKEAVEESGMKDAGKELAQEFKEKCKDAEDEEACKKFLATNRKEQEAMVDEYDIRSRAMLGKIEKLKKSKDKAGLEKYLREEGYTDDQISEMIKDDAKVEKLWATIEEKYKNARENLVESMRKRLEGNTTKKDGEVTFSAQNGQKDDKTAIDTIAAELTDKTDRYADLVHFNNIVSGYLEVGEGSDAKRNTASMFAELESAGEARKDSVQGIRDAATAAGISDTRENENSDPASLGISEINEHILDHDTK